MNKHFEASDHRGDKTNFAEIQSQNQAWWTDHTMSYDWDSNVKTEKYSLPWYEEVDRRFIYDSRLYGHEQKPFDRLIDYEAIRGKKVLEIGCGMGLHAELFCKAGADLTCVDISETSANATRKRLELKGLKANVIHQDAEMLPFQNGEFDFVWSWGVIHHSSRTALIVREIARVLKKDGGCSLMVYNRCGAGAWRAILKYQVLRLGALRGRSVDEALNRGTDGFHARHYTRDQFEDLFRAYFKDVTCDICGQVPDALPLPRIIRRIVQPMVSEQWLKNAQAKRGSFLFLKAKNLI